MGDDVFERGMRLRREIHGDDAVNEAEGRRTPFTSDFLDFYTKYVFGEIWSRPQLDRRTRSCITIAMLVALNRPESLRRHLQVADRHGVTRDEIGEIILQAAAYCGVPAANAAFRIAQEVLES